MISSIGPLFYPGTFVDPTSNIFTATVNNLWSNPANWSYARVPLTTDRARIRGLCNVDIVAVCDELVIDSTFILNFNASRTLTFNSILNSGTINCNTTSSVLFSNVNNTRNTTWGTINFDSAGTMHFINDSGTTITVPNLDYYHLTSGQVTTRLGTRNLAHVCTIRGNLSASKGILNVSANLIVNGSSVFGGEAYGFRASNCTVTFNGAVTNPNSDSFTFNNCTVYANANISFRGFGSGDFFTGTLNTLYLGAGAAMTGSSATIALGKGITDVICRTNNQTLSLQNSNFKSLTIEGNITVTYSTGTIATSSINGTTSLSKLQSRSTINYSGSTIPMTTGVLDLSSFVNTFSYTFIGNQSLNPCTYWHLNLQSNGVGTFTKTATGNLTTLGNLYTQGGFLLELGVYDITINGTCTQDRWVATNGRANIRKYTPGNMIFKGYFISATSASLDVAANSPTTIIEFQGGGNTDGYLNYKQCTVKWTTNNQTWTFPNTARASFDNLSILNGIAATVTSPNNGGIDVTNTVTGSTGATFNILSLTRVNMAGATPFVNCTVTGTINTRMTYTRTGVQTIASGTYGSLIISTSGSAIKTAQGNITVNSTLSVTGSNLNLSTFNLDVFSSTSYSSSTITKSTAGLILYRGLVTYNTTVNSFTNSGLVVEYRGGINCQTTFNHGVAVVKFTTNNQSVNHNNCNTTIETAIIEAINLTNQNNGLLITGTITGTTALTSILTVSGTLYYTGSTALLSTGQLVLNSGSTVSYLRSGSQLVRGGTYQNLTLAGTATPNNKTLQGNVSVVGIYTVTGNAVRVDNGFTFGNP